MLNWAGMAFKMAQTDFNLGADIMNITADYMSSKARQAGLAAQQKNFRLQGERAVESAAQTQRAGMLERERRMVKAGQDISRINASAAGSGLDITSATVRKTIADTERSAENDARVIAWNERIAAQSHVNDAQSAWENEAWAWAAKRQEAENRKMRLWGGILTAGANWTMGMLESGQKLMGGFGGGVGQGAQMFGGMGGAAGG